MFNTVLPSGVTVTVVTWFPAPFVAFSYVEFSIAIALVLAVITSPVVAVSKPVEYESYPVPSAFSK